MSNILIVGYVTEGSTDVRFLESVIYRTFVEISLECNSDIEIYSLQNLSVHGNTFVEKVTNAVIEADRRGVMVLCVHSDADANNDNKTFKDRIIPAFESVYTNNSLLCKNLVAIVPISMIESWMLADTELLKAEICTSMRDIDLGIHRSPETISDPKTIISDALRQAHEGGTRKRRKQLNIAELYQPIGQKISLQQLEILSSYRKFKEDVRQSFINLNYLN